MEPDLNNEPDLTDEVVLVEWLKNYAEMMHQQAEASRAGNAMGGCPYPAYMYERVSEILTVAREKIMSRRGGAPADDKAVAGAGKK